jgi:hypothetical protein
MIYPGQVDPPYDRAPWLVEWLDERTDPDVVVPFPIERSMADSYNKDPLGVGYTTHTLTRRKASAPAPYVGAPFEYVWWALVDDYGRGVGGQEVERVYAVPYGGYPMTDAEFTAALDRLEFP